MAVWVKHGTAPAFLVALVENKLDLKSLSERLELNVKSLKAGDFALDADASGMSRHVDEIKAFAGMADGGDGSKSCPFVIEGEAIVPSRVVTGGSASVPHGITGSDTRVFTGLFERDVTFELRDQMAVPAMPLPQYYHLWDFVSRTPGVRFAVPAVLYLRLPSQNREKIFRPAEAGENCLEIVPFVSKLIDPPMAGGSESNFHQLYDTLISDVMAFFFVAEAWVRIRDQAGEGSSGIKRPDLIARFAQFYALFRAEEKGPRSKGDPEKEITDKMEWTYGTSIPYILGYYAREYLVTFCSIRCMEGINMRDDIVTLDLSTAKDRVELFIVCLNLARLLTTLRDLCISTTAPPDITEYERENGKVVQIFGKKVAKIYEQSPVYDHIFGIYMELVGCPFAEVMLHFNHEDRTLVMERGFACKPGSVKLLVECVFCICQALVWLHDHGLMHRDIRWENVARRFDGGGWILLDFDEACSSPSQGAAHHLKPETHAPEVTLGVHTTSVDIWGVGYLLSSWKNVIGLPISLVELRDRCLHPEAHVRLSARECLTVLKPLYDSFFYM